MDVDDLFLTYVIKNTGYNGGGAVMLKSKAPIAAALWHRFITIGLKKATPGCP
jgi:hypothetical protein